MLVYGDHCECIGAAEKWREIAGILERLNRTAPGIARHAILVSALIECGRLFQGLADAEFKSAGCDCWTPETRSLGRFVHELATAVGRSWDEGCTGDVPVPQPPSMPATAENLELRVPEGFAFYCVYPEAFAVAARTLRLLAPPRVIGIRSIGTTLGAMVAAALDAPPAVTLRPFGDPFARKIAVAPELAEELLSGSVHYIIVDEGPGQSGSSFGCVADWLESRGVRRSHIAFVASHAGDLGPHASASHRQRWRDVQRAVAEFGPRLPDLLTDWCKDLLGPFDAPPADISAGKWRVLWPEEPLLAVNPMWERRKFLASAGRQTWLLKFAGLSAEGERKLAIAQKLAAAGLTPQPRGLAHGFLVERWEAKASPLRPFDKPIQAIGRYIGTRAQLLAPETGSGASPGEMLEMMRRNVGIALGADAARMLDRWEPRLAALATAAVPMRTDSRLDPHEWLVAADGRLLKCDALDHHAGHDLVGCQDIAWDLAGATIEFGLDEWKGQELRSIVEARSGRRVDAQLLDFMTLAYLAFRIGQSRLSAEMTRPVEAERHRSRALHYADELRRRLPPTGSPAELSAFQLA